MICHELRSVFVHIPKTAGQSIEEFYLRKIGLGWSKRQHVHVGILKAGVRSAHLFADEYLQHMTREQWEYYDKFTVVRNPWARAVSSWRYLAPQMPFNEYLAMHVTDTTYRRHGATQCRFLHGFDGRILRFESLDFRALPKRNMSTPCDFRKFYDDESRELIAVAYAEDIERWGYEFD